MSSQVIFDLDNEVYHRGAEYSEYISSTTLKKYKISPLAAHEAMTNPQELTSPGVLLGTKFHNIMEQVIKGLEPEDAVNSLFACFIAPVSESGIKLRANSNAYKEAYSKFVEENQGKEIVTEDELHTLKAMVVSVMNNKLAKKLIRWAAPDKEKMTGSEIAVLSEVDGVKCKIKMDALTSNKILDFKTTSSSDLSEDSINKAIFNFGYDISAAFYQKVMHELTQSWYSFYEIFVQTTAPYDCVIVDMRHWSYNVEDGDIINDQTHGCLECNALMEIHKECLENNEWPGADAYIAPDDKGNRVLCPMPSPWMANQLTKKY